MDEAAPSSPRQVNKVAVGYDLTALPPAIIRCFTVLRSKLERAGYSIQVGLRPLNDLPPDLDVLFISGELEARARQARPEVEIKLLHLHTGHQVAFDELLHELDTGQKLGARPAPPDEGQADSPRREIQRYRGHERIA
jgi:hypothetical protein